MTEEEMIKWAQFPGTSSADFNAVGHHEAQKRLIWIAQREAAAAVWGLIAGLARQNHDIERLATYKPHLERKKSNG